MTDYTWPSTLYPNADSLLWQDASATFRSPLGGTVRTVNRTGGRWKLSMQFSALTSDQAQTLEAFLFRLDGVTHRAVIPCFSYRRQATITGTVVVSGASQTGTSLVTSGWAQNTTVMKAGDRFTVENNMYVVVADATAAAGVATLSLHTILRSSPANGASINYSAPTARYLLAEPAQVAAMPGVFKSLALEFDEAFP